MIRQAKTVVTASFFGLAAVHCGSSSQRPSETPAPPPIEAEPEAPGVTSTPSTPASEPATTERIPTAGRDEPLGLGEAMRETMGDPTGSPAALPLSDAQVVAIADLVNNAEIQQAELAQSKSQRPEVVNYAAMMIRDHGLDRQKLETLGLSSVSSPVSQMLSAQGQQTLSKLESASGADFDRTYMQTQVEEHQRVLDTIDRQLLPSAKNPQLRDHLQNMRGTVAHHLQAARDTQQALSSSPPPGQTPSGASGTQPSPTDMPPMGPQ